MADAGTQTPTPGASTWEQEKAKMERELAESRSQLSGLSNERNAYRQKAEAWERIGKEAGDVVRYDPVTGLPVGWNTGDAPPPPVVTTGTHPFYGIVENPQTVDAYYQALVQQQVNQAGYITQPQAQALMQQAYAAARGDLMVMRTYDKLTVQEPYKPLGDYGSDLSKRTATILQERNLGRPLEGAKGFDQWQYANLEALQFASDMARLQIHEEAQKAAAETAAAAAAQAGAGLSVGAGAGGVTPPPAGEPPRTADGRVDWEKVQRDATQRGAQLGVSA